MRTLDKFYLRLLKFGFLILKQAADEGDSAWLKAEIEFLHNVPSLIGETNVQRHRYFWLAEREMYLSWIETHGADRAKSRMRTYYRLILEEMEPIVSECVLNEN